MTDTTLEASEETPLEALEILHTYSRTSFKHTLTEGHNAEMDRLMRIASAALSVVGEPVAWRFRSISKGYRCWYYSDNDPSAAKTIYDVEPLYALPPLPTIGG